jgi:hypothetical protein
MPRRDPTGTGTGAGDHGTATPATLAHRIIVLSLLTAVVCTGCVSVTSSPSSMDLGAELDNWDEGAARTVDDAE